MLNELKVVAQSLIDHTMAFGMHCRLTQLIHSAVLYQIARVKSSLYLLINLVSILLLLSYSADYVFWIRALLSIYNISFEVTLLTLYAIDLFRGFIHFHFPRNIPRIFDKPMICKWNAYF